MGKAEVVAVLIGLLYICGSTLAHHRRCKRNVRFQQKYGQYANSDEFDSLEAERIYEIPEDEKFIPPFADTRTIVCNPDYPYRTFDGSCNNIQYPKWGKPNSTYITREPALYGDSLRTPRRGFNDTDLPNARKIRTELFATSSVTNKLWNINAMIFGQFFAHDMSLLSEPKEPFECCTENADYVSKRGRFCYPIKVPADDPTMGMSGIKCMNFSRTITDKDLGYGDPDAPAKQINTVTPYLDLSNVYGLNDDMNAELRAFVDGKLLTETRFNHTYPPMETSMQTYCPCNLPGENVCYKTGDSRSNQNPELAIMQILFVREHNRIADELKTLNPCWHDEKLFQEARRILIAMYQRITYYEWLPIFHGYDDLIKANIIYNETITNFVDDYDNATMPAIFNEHAHAAFRYFHTHIEGQLQMLDQYRQQVQTFTLGSYWGRPNIIEAAPKNIEELTIGMVTQNMQETDDFFVSDVSDKFMACGKQYGIDLKAADIQRDRDHGLRYYNDYRKSCGLKVATCFEDYEDLISHDNVEKLKKLYTNFADVDLSVGGALENLANGTQFGPTFLCLVNQQFHRTRVTDRFWYESPRSGFTLDQLNQIKNATISGMFCTSGDGITQIQPKGFTLIFDSFNALTPCSNIPKINLAPWKDKKCYPDEEEDEEKEEIVENHDEEVPKKCKHKHREHKHKKKNRDKKQKHKKRECKHKHKKHTKKHKRRYSSSSEYVF